ncbi:MAG TPA: glutamate synthase large subunit, partial [Rhodothermales bacterium]|nr:glutamate synthase large subunit [Rhodothermales bacterium]
MYNSNSPDGLYDLSRESDACGVGFICHVSGEPTHDIVRKGLEILANLEHRGACGCDARTGDGAGILIQVPDALLRRKAEENGFSLPPRGEYGVGMLFLPSDPEQRRVCMELVNAAIRAEKQELLGWREVPTNDAHLGDAAKEREPAIWQVFVGRGTEIADGDAFERKLYVIRKIVEKQMRGSGLPQEDYFYVCSLSARTIIYKGMLTTDQLPEYFGADLGDPLIASALAIVHSRFSTNTFPMWRLAHPFRFLAHNGEINTLRGNVNWMNTRQALFESPLFGEDMAKLLPILTEGDSDSATLDNALELLYFTGRSLPHAVMMLIPEAWEGHEEMPAQKRAFYEYHACLMEPWDGPATIPFTDGRYIGAVLDRNGLRPSRYTVTRDGLVVLASETGVLDIDPSDIIEKGRLQPGRMFLVDLKEHRIVSDEEIKDQVSRRQPYAQWVQENMLELEDLPEHGTPAPFDEDERTTQQRLFGYTLEDLRILMPPMGDAGKEALGSMGDDTPLAVLSDRPRLVYDYIRQLFAQVTNPPLDAIREELVTSLFSIIGGEGDLFEESPQHCRQLRLDGPILTDDELARIKYNDLDELRAKSLPMLFEVELGPQGLDMALHALCEAASEAIDEGYHILILSDRGAGVEQAPIPALLATAAVHHHLIRLGKRTRCGLVIESAEPREVHHFACLIGYGASAVNPYLALETIVQAVRQEKGKAEDKKVVKSYRKALHTGILKVMSKMGVSTLSSYQGAQIFEAIGLSRSVIDPYFTGTASRIGGVGLDVIAKEVLARHEAAYPQVEPSYGLELSPGGRYQWRRGGEHHLFNPLSIAKLQHSVRQGDPKTFSEFSTLINDQSRTLGTLRGLLEFDVDPSRSIPLDEVEPWTEIVKRFKTGAMSYGSISSEAHEALAIAMNKLGGRSNTGEGGEDPSRYERGNPRRSRIKQVASGRFGVTIGYLVSADEIQIKMAQGAKPGEGGQLPGEKVYPWIARTRHSTPYVGLISPPPHHDIYSIEDLAQLIHDLKNANTGARISVKLVSEVGVGTVAAGVAKGKADVVLISGHDGGTGASPQTSIAHAGLPWELGLAETHQTLVRNGLRSRIKVECDGQLKTGRDVAVAALLGAEEFGFATAPLVAMGCIMMRKCHLNTCPVGIATQDPELRKKFTGSPEHVVNYLYFIAEELRQIMADLGFRTIEEMVGRPERLKVREGLSHWKARHLDLSPLLRKAETPGYLAGFSTYTQDHGIENALDNRLIEQAAPALESGQRVVLDVVISNTNRTLGTMLSAEVARRFGESGLPDDTIVLNCKGSAGQSFMAFGAPGITVRVEGDANDYFGKGLSGSRLILYPPMSAAFDAEDNIIVGNVAMYGATSGEVYVRGHAGERFCVRNSGVHAVVEGVGDHACEYMTGGRVVVLGTTGRNFAAGMSGG